MALITLLWLIVPACRLSRILVKKVEDTESFRRHIRKIHAINLAFIISIIYEIVFTALYIISYKQSASDSDGISGLKKFLEIKALSLCLGSYIPVGAIAFNHFSNIQSLNLIFKLLWQR